MNISFSKVFRLRRREGHAWGLNFHALKVLILAVVTLRGIAAPFTLALLDEVGGEPRVTARDVAVRGNHLFTVTAEGMLFVHDITDPTNEREIARLPVPNRCERVVIEGDSAYVAFENGIHVVDISNVAEPRTVGGFVGGSPREIAVKDKVLFFGDFAGASAVDLTVPAEPRWMEPLALGETKSVVIVGDTLFVAAAYEVYGFDISNAKAPMLMNSQSGASRAFASGNRLYLQDVQIFSVLDITDSAAPQMVGRVYPIGFPEEFVVAGNYGYSFYSPMGIEILDLRVEQSSFMPVLAERSYSNFRVFDGRLFAVSGTGGVEILNLSEPTRPRRIGQVAVRTGSFDIALADDRAFSANGGAGTKIYDTRNASDVKLVGVIPTSGVASGVAVNGNFAYVAAGYMGFEVADVSNPAAPRVVGRLATTGKSLKVAVNGSMAFVADLAGLTVIDVSDPANPVRRAGPEETGFFGEVSDLELRDGLVYTAGTSFWIFEILPPLFRARWVGQHWLSDFFAFDRAVKP